MRTSRISKLLTILICSVIGLSGCGQTNLDTNAITTAYSTINAESELPYTGTTETMSSHEYSDASADSYLYETSDTSSEYEMAVSKESNPDSTFSVHFIDVGQADAALVECDKHYMLIDGGNKDDSDKIYSVLKNASVPKLDMIVATHGHEDHIGGLPGALSYTTADLTLCPVTDYDSNAFSDFKRYADMNGNGITIPDVNDTYSLGSADIKILGVNSESDTNNTSIVLKITYGNTSFLFTGDAEREAEQVILNNNTDLSTTVLKVGHHGSETSTSYPFLREIMPKYAVISVGENNKYGHPADNTLSKLRDADVEIYRTDLNGDIIAYSDGNTITFETKRISTAFENPQTSMITSMTETTAIETTAAVTSASYVVNTNTGKFHHPSCSSAKKIKSENRLDYTGNRDDLTAQGYIPCKNCNP